MVCTPLFTEDQLINKALLVIKLTGAFKIAITEWNKFDAENKNWHKLKAHFSNAYNIRLGIGSGTACMAGYHGAANVVDNGSLGSITNSITQI